MHRVVFIAQRVLICLYLSSFLIVSFGLVKRRNPNLKYKSEELKQRAPLVGFEAGQGLEIPQRRVDLEDDEGNIIPIPVLCIAYDLCDSKMDLINFKATLPQAIKVGDKIRITGTMIGGAKQFSINFVNENQQFITYHFKANLAEGTIVENWKSDGEWRHHKEVDYNGFGVDATSFDLEFAFHAESIFVYKCSGDDGRCFITEYKPKYAYELVESVRVWGEVEKVTKLTLSFA